MSDMNSPLSCRTYGAISQTLHWLMAFLILLMLILGWGSGFMHNEWKPVLLNLHKSIGITILLLAVGRLGWRFYCTPPSLPDDFSRLTKAAAHGTHGFLYFLLFFMPVSGWALVSAYGRTPSFFGLFDLPALMDKNTALVPYLRLTHSISAYLLAGLIVLHIAAALVHHFIFKDKTLIRMLPILEKQNS